jgi:Protein of unknown function (DUF3180)
MATPPPDDPNPKARLEPTRPATLAVAALAAMALSWIGISTFWNELPTLPWLPPLILIGLAVYEAAEALATKNRIDRRHGAGPVQPLIIARFAVLAKASALAGALFGGLYLGITAWLLTQRGVLAQVSDNLPQAVLGTAGSILFVAAALWLERSCRIPPPPRDREGQEVTEQEEDDQPA